MATLSRQQHLSSAAHRRHGPGCRDLRRSRGRSRRHGAGVRGRRPRRASRRALAPAASARTTVANIAFIAIIALLAWAAWALVTFEVGGRLMPEPQTRVDVGELLRTIGFAVDARNAARLGRLAARHDARLCHYLRLDAAGDDRRRAPGARLPQHRPAVAVCVLGWVLALTFAVGLGLLFGPSVS